MTKSKTRPDPHTQGVLAKLYKLFLEPLIIYKPVDVQLAAWNEFLFHSRFVDIIQYRARRTFEMPGLLYVAGSVKIQGLGDRHIKRNQLILVRKDLRNTYYDVQFFGGVGGRDQVFNLSESQWNSVGANLEEVPARGMRSKLTKSMEKYIHEMKKVGRRAST